MTLEELKIVISAQTEPLRKEMEGVRKQLGGLQNETNKITSGIQGAFKKLLGGIIALQIGRKIGQAIFGGIKEAMNVEAALQQIKRIMGESTNQFLKWANTQAIAFNMSKGEALKYGSVFGNLISGFAKSTQETTKYTEDLLKASSIIASATGRSMQDVMERIRSGMLGSTEAIEDLGVNVNVAMLESTEAFKKFANGKSWNQLSFQTQQQIRLMGILEQTNKKYGDTIQQNTSSQLQQLVAHLNNVKLSLGQAFLPIVQIVLPVLTSLAQQLSYVMGIAAQFSQALFGKSMQTGNKQAQNTQAQAKAMTGLGNATEKAGKQAKGALAGFDEINNLADNSDSGAAAGGGIDPSTMGMGAETMGLNFETNAPDISAEIQAMAESVKAKVKSITGTIKDNKEIIISAVGGVVGAFATFQTLTFLSTIPTTISQIGVALSALLTPIAIVSLVIGGLVASFLYLYQTNEQFRNDINAVWSDISNTLNSFVNDTLAPIFSYIINDFLAPLGVAFREYILPVLAELFIGIGNILDDILKFLQSTLDNAWNIVKPGLDLIKNIVVDVLAIIKDLWDKHGETLINNVRNFIKGVQDTFQLIWDNIINPIIQPALEMLTWLWEKHLKELVEEVGNFIMKLVNGALEIYNGFIKPIIDWLVVTFGPTVASVINLVIDVFGSMVGGIADIAKGLFKTLGGIVDFIVGIFTGNWKKAWEGVKSIFGGIFDSLLGLVKVPLNYIIDAVNFVIRGLNKIKISTPDWVPGIGGKSFGINIAQIPKLARGGIIDSPTLAMVGEAGKEAVMPLENNTGWIDDLASKINSRNQGGANGPVTIILKIGNTELGRVIIDSLNDYARQHGELPITI